MCDIVAEMLTAILSMPGTAFPISLQQELHNNTDEKRKVRCSSHYKMVKNYILTSSLLLSDPISFFYTCHLDTCYLPWFLRSFIFTPCFINAKMLKCKIFTFLHFNYFPLNLTLTHILFPSFKNVLEKK